MSESPASTFVAEVVRTVRLGVVGVFGIVVPGIWFWATMLFYVAYAWGVSTLGELGGNLTILATGCGPLLGWIVGFVVVYVTGSVLRILRPDLPDLISLRWIRLWDKSHEIGSGERFPYSSLPAYLAGRGVVGLARLLPWRDEGAGATVRASKSFIHFPKVLIAVHSAQLADHLARQEAFIRLLSGVFYAFLCSTPVLVLAVVLQHAWNQIAQLSLLILLLNLLIACGILRAFHYQRLRELTLIMSAYFLLGPLDRLPYATPPAPDESTRVEGAVGSRVRTESDHGSQGV